LAMHDVYAVIKSKGSGGHGVTPMVGNGGVGMNSTGVFRDGVIFRKMNTGCCCACLPSFLEPQY